MTHLLYSETIDLTLYEGKIVGIEGAVDATLKWPIPAIKVTGIVLNPASTSVPEDETPDREAPDKDMEPPDETH